MPDNLTLPDPYAGLATFDPEPAPVPAKSINDPYAGLATFDSETPTVKPPPSKDPYAQIATFDEPTPTAKPLEENWIKLLPSALGQESVNELKAIGASALPFRISEKLFGAPEPGISSTAGQIAGTLASFVIPGGIATKAAKLPALVNTLGKIAAIPKYGKFLATAAEQLFTTGTAFGLQSQIQMPLLSSIKDRAKTAWDTEKQAAMFAGIGVAGAIGGKIGKALAWPAMFGMGYEMAGDKASPAEKFVNGTVMVFLHGLSSGMSRDDAEKATAQAVKEQYQVNDAKADEMVKSVTESPETQDLINNVENKVAPARSTQTTQVQRESVLPKLEASGGGVISETKVTPSAEAPAAGTLPSGAERPELMTADEIPLVRREVIIEKLSTANPGSILRADIGLHEAAIKRNAWKHSKSGQDFIRSDMDLKRNALAYLENGKGDATELIRGLESDKDIHKQYLTRPRNSATGNKQWHEAWMTAYDRVIDAIKNKPSSSPSAKPAETGAEGAKGTKEPISRFDIVRYRMEQKAKRESAINEITDTYLEANSILENGGILPSKTMTGQTIVPADMPKGKRKLIPKEAEEHQGIPDIFKHQENAKGGLPLDEMADQLGISEDALKEKMAGMAKHYDDILSGKSRLQEGPSGEDLQAEYETKYPESAKWEKTQEQVRKTGDQVTSGEFKVGDSFTIGGERYSVVDEGETGLTVKDGRELFIPYETPTDKSEQFFIDKGSLKKPVAESRGELGLGKQDLTLTGEKIVDTERVQKEKDAAVAKQAELERRAQELPGIENNTIPYSKDLDIRNLDALGRGTGARYLEVVKGEGSSFVAKQWRRKPVEGALLIDMESPPEGARGGVGEVPVGPGAATAGSSEFTPGVSIKRAYLDSDRERMGFPQRDTGAPRPWPEAIDEAERRLAQNPEAERVLVEQRIADPKGATDDIEVFQLNHARLQAGDAFNQANIEANQAAESGDEVRIADAEAKRAIASDWMQKVIKAAESVTGSAGRTLGAVRAVVSEEFEIDRLESAKRAANKNRQLSKEERAEIQRVHDAWNDANDRANKLQAEVDALRQQQQADTEEDAAKKELTQKAKEKTATEKKSGKKPDLERDKNEAIARIQAAIEAGGKPASSDIKQLALYFEQKNIDLNNSRSSEGFSKEVKQQIEANRGKSTLSFRDIVNGVHEVVKRFASDTDYNEIRDAISDYGKNKPLSEDAAKAALAQVRMQLQKVASIEIVQKNIAELQDKLAAAQLNDTKRTGPERYKPGEEARDLTTKLNNAMKEQDRLMKDAGIERGDAAKRLKSGLDAKATRLKNKRDSLIKALEEHKKIAKAEPSDLNNEKTKALEAEIEELQPLYDAMFPPEPMTDQQRLDRAIQAAERSKADWDARVEDAKKGIFRTKEPGKPLPESEKLDNLNKGREDAKEEVNRLHDLAFPKATPEERALKAWKTRALKRMDMLTKRMEAGDFSKPPPKIPIKLDEEGLKIAADKKRIERAWKESLQRDERAHWSWWEKLADQAVGWRKGFVISGFRTLAKVFAYTPEELATRALTETAGGLLEHVPGIGKIISGAPIEGGFSPAIFMRSLKSMLTKGFQDMKAGTPDFEEVYGKHLGDDSEPYRIPAKVHKAEKAYMKRFGYELAKEKQETSEARTGVSRTTEEIGKAAYEHAQQGILMEDNAVADAISAGLGTLGKKGGIPGRLGAAAIRTQLPVIRIPLNHFKAVMEYSFGHVTGLGRAAYHLVKGIDKMTVEQKESIARQLKRGTVAAALSAYAFYDGYKNQQNSMFGGLYQPGEKRRPGQLRVGELRLGQQKIWSMFLAHPILVSLQFWNTVGRIAGSRDKKTGAEMGVAEGMLGGLFSIMETAPVANESLRISKLVDPRTRTTALGDMLRGYIVPIAVEDMAKMMDLLSGGGNVATVRKPKTILQGIEEGIPGLRNLVPPNPKSNAQLRADEAIRISRSKANVTLDTYQSQFSTLKDMVNPDTGRKYTENDIYGIVENRTSTGGDPHWKAMSPTERKAAVEYLNQVIQARRREATEAMPEPPPPDAMSIMREMRGTMTPKQREMFDLREKSSVYGK